jgi:3D (Asp-Asp-Asp) domain-containing protein
MMFETISEGAEDWRRDALSVRHHSARVPGQLRLWLSVALAFGTIAGCGGEPQTLTVTATAYNSVAEQTQGDPNTGAWGDEIRPGDKVIAVSPDLLSLGLEPGTNVQIEGLPGTYRVADRTHSRLERTIDIYMGTDIEKAREWGRRQVEIRWQD